MATTIGKLNALEMTGAPNQRLNQRITILNESAHQYAANAPSKGANARDVGAWENSDGLLS
jgi:hypothetical protein